MYYKDATGVINNKKVLIFYVVFFFYMAHHRSTLLQDVLPENVTHVVCSFLSPQVSSTSSSGHKSTNMTTPRNMLSALRKQIPGSGVEIL